jgi:hypothetical protein
MIKCLACGGEVIAVESQSFIEARRVDIEAGIGEPIHNEFAHVSTMLECRACERGHDLYAIANNGHGSNAVVLNEMLTRLRDAIPDEQYWLREDFTVFRASHAMDWDGWVEIYRPLLNDILNDIVRIQFPNVYTAVVHGPHYNGTINHAGNEH